MLWFIAGLLVAALLGIVFIMGKEVTMVRDMSNLHAQQTILSAKMTSLDKTVNAQAQAVIRVGVEHDTHVRQRLDQMYEWVKPDWVRQQELALARTRAIESLDAADFDKIQDGVVEGLRARLADMTPEEFEVWVRELGDRQR